jgi:DNA-binding NarL/FixJ family response regulator
VPSSPRNNSQHSLLLVARQPVVLAGLESILGKNGDFTIVGRVREGSDAVRKSRELAPDAVVTDCALPDMTAFELTRLLAACCPSTRVIAMASHPDAEQARELSRTGASGYLAGESGAETILDAVRAVVRGERHFPPLAPNRSSPNARETQADRSRSLLSRREIEVLRGIASGATNKQMADRLGISVRTVETHRGHIMQKLGVQGTAGLTKWAIGRGLVDPRIDGQFSRIRRRS